MGKIKILSEDVVNKIAAGEVVERPVNVVKELVENALDAGADKIEIEVRDGGISFIRVKDNGVGIDEKDLPLTVARFATSKIERFDDLFRLNSFGFRGEALSAISSVSNFTISSKGFELNVDFGKINDVKPAPYVNGTVVTVKNLFSKLPARFKFLKSANSELREITKFIKSVALLNSDVHFVFTNNGTKVLEFFKNENLGKRAEKVFMEEKLKEFSFEKDGIKVEGITSLPLVQKYRKDNIIIGVNSRVIKDNLIVQAILQAYRRKLPENRYPITVLNLILPGDLVDVNIHPAKMFVKFFDTNSIFSVVYHAIENCLENKDEKKFNDIYSHKNDFEVCNVSSKVADVKGVNYSVDFTELFPTINLDTESVNRDDFKIVGQLFNTVIVVEKGDEVLFIDQHIAHERVLFESLMNGQDVINSVILTEPIIINCEENEVDFVEKHLREFKYSGFDIDVFDRKLLKVNAVPAEIINRDIEKEIKEIVNEIKNTDVKESIFLNVSCKCAIKAGDKLLENEMMDIVRRLFKTKNPYTCPHGRSIIFTMKKEELFRKFNR